MQIELISYGERGALSNKHSWGSVVERIERVVMNDRACGSRQCHGDDPPQVSTVACQDSSFFLPLLLPK